MKTWIITSIVLLAAAALGLYAYNAEPIGHHDQDPKIVSQVEPTYPFDAARTGTEGTVLVKFTVNTKGEVMDPVVVGSTDRIFEPSALAAVKQWKFQPPAMHEGQPVPVPVLRLIRFGIKEGATVKTTDAEFIKMMKLRTPLANLVSHDPCFCGSGKILNECHGK